MGLEEAHAGLSIWGFIKNHWYIIISIIFILPLIISIIQDPTNGLIKLGQKLVSADNLINHDVNLLKTNSTELIGMSAPTSESFDFLIYYWKFFWNVIYEISTNVWLIFFPLAIIYFIVGLFSFISPFKKISISLVIFITYLIIINAIFLFIDSSLVIPNDLDTFQKFKFVFVNILPFHGVFNLIGYIISQVK